jgi:hypothetical protein
MTHPATHIMALIVREDSGRDEYGNQIRSETAVQVVGLFAPGGSTESTAGEDRVVTQPRMLLQPGQTIPSAIDAAVPDPVLVLDGDGVLQFDLDENDLVQGDRFDVDGAPEVWEPGVVVKLIRQTG